MPVPCLKPAARSCTVARTVITQAITASWASMAHARDRWFVFAMCLLLASASGASYAFGLFAEALRHDLGFSSSDLAWVSAVGGSGLYFGVVAGLLVEHVDVRWVVRFGCACIATGLTLVWLVTHNRVIAEKSVGFVAALLWISNFGANTFATSATLVGLRNFPAEARGTVAGTVKAWLGLSSAVLSQLNKGFFSTGNSNFILFMAIWLTSIGVVSSQFVVLLPESVGKTFHFERTHGVSTSFRPWLGHLVVLMVFVLSVGAVEELVDPPRMYLVAGAIGTIVLLFALMFFPQLHRAAPAGNAGGRQTGEMGEQEDGEAECDDSERQLTDDPKEPLLGHGRLDSGSSSQDEKQEDDKIAERSARVLSEVGQGGAVDIPLSQAVRFPSFWLLFFVFMANAGSGLTVINNVQSIARAVNMSPSSFLVTTLAVGNTMGRAVVGMASDTTRFTRLQLLAMVSATMTGTNILFSAGTSELLYVLVAVSSFCYGATFALLASLAADLYGPRHVGAVYGALDLAPATGGILFASIVVNAFYGSSSNCTGAHCYAGSFLINAVCCGTGCLLSYGLHLRLRQTM